jgi:two-component system, chemotaxis family, sensor kinase Cph1
MLMQLFQNLISNSIKYRGKETPENPCLGGERREGWLFAVRDNGIGIDPQDAERVFGMFKRLHGSEIPGTGIGLALCKKDRRAQGRTDLGGIGTGQGATFKFTIPRTIRIPPPPRAN